MISTSSYTVKRDMAITDEEPRMRTAWIEIVDSGPSIDEPTWFACWYDHASRLIKRRLGFVSEMGDYLKSGKEPARVKRAAREAVDDYIVKHEAMLEAKHAATDAEIEEMVQYASFPRVVVAVHIERICERIARWEANDENRAGMLGLQLFSERAKISSREAHRLVEEDERIKVGSDTVDKICCEFDMLFDDFIGDSLEWADKKGQWADRPGTEDAWPFGYVQIERQVDEDLI
jgi:hypothetical protein